MYMSYNIVYVTIAIEFTHFLSSLLITILTDCARWGSEGSGGDRKTKVFSTGSLY